MPSFTFGGRHSLEKPNNNPGNYSVKILFQNVSIYLKTIPIPAPCAYETEKVNLDHTPSYTFGVKTNHLKTNDTPGTYNLIYLLVCCLPVF